MHFLLPPSLLSPLLGLIQPPLTAVLARLVLGEPLGARGAAGCLVSLAGVAFICQPPFLFGSHTAAAAAASAADGGGAGRMLGSAFGLAAAVLSSGSYLSIRKLGGAEPAPVVALAFHTATIAMSVPPLALGWPRRAAALSAHDASLLAAVAATSFFAQLLMTRALQCANAARVSAASFTQVIYSYALSALAFGEGVTLVNAAGVLCTLCGVALVVLRHGPKAAAPPATSADAPQQQQQQQPLLSSARLSESAGRGSLAERVLLKQASVAAGATATAATASAEDSTQQEVDAAGAAAGTAAEQAGESGGSDAPPPPPAGWARQSSLRAMSSFKRLGAGVSAFVVDSGASAAAAAAANAPLAALRGLAAATSAQMSTSASMTAADLALAAEGACSACTAALVASAAALEAFGGGAAPPLLPAAAGDERAHLEADAAREAAAFAAAAAAGAADAVAAAFAFEDGGAAFERAAGGEAALEDEMLIPAGYDEAPAAADTVASDLCAAPRASSRLDDE